MHPSTKLPKWLLFPHGSCLFVRICLTDITICLFWHAGAASSPRGDGWLSLDKRRSTRLLHYYDNPTESKLISPSGTVLFCLATASETICALRRDYPRSSFAQDEHLNKFRIWQCDGLWSPRCYIKLGCHVQVYVWLKIIFYIFSNKGVYRKTSNCSYTPEEFCFL